MPPARLLVVAQKFDFRLSRASVPAVLVRIEVVDFGEDPHDPLLRRPGGPTIRLPVVKAGERTVRTVRLAPGRYRLWCGVGDHRARGMWAWLRVVRRVHGANSSRSRHTRTCVRAIRFPRGSTLRLPCRHA